MSEDRRENPQDKQEAEFQEILGYYEANGDGSQDTLVSALREIQEVYGFIPPEKIQETGRRMGVKEGLIEKLIKLYPSLKAAPYKHRVRVCIGPNCGKKGGPAILEAAKKAAADRGGSYFEVTSSGCLKHCPTSPNMMVDNDVYNHVKPENVASILGKY